MKHVKLMITQSARALALGAAIIMLFTSTLSHADQVPHGITLQGTILTPAGTPQEAASVVFTIAIRSPGLENCLLFEESHTLNMTNSRGAFSLTLGAGSRSGSDFEDTSNLLQVFNNSEPSLSGLNCASGSSYAPAANHSRNIHLSFNDGSGEQTLTQPLAVNAVPFALHADLLQGKQPADFIQIIDSNSQSRFANIFDTRYSDIEALLDGSSPLYTSENGANFTPTSSLNLNSQTISNLATPINSSDATNKNYTDSNIAGKAADTSTISSLDVADAGKVMSWNGSQWTATTITASPGGSTSHVQFNNSGSFAGDSNMVWDNTNKRLGVGTSAPAESIHAGGAVVVGATTTSCTTTNRGAIRYNNVSSVLEFCNGTSWNLVQAAACSDATPNVIALSDEANASTSSLYESNIVQVSGINCSVPVTISGAGSPQFRICSDSACASEVQGWTSSPSSIVNNQYLQTRLTSDIVPGSMFQATLIVGSSASVWSVTNSGTDCSTGSPVPGTVCSDGTIYAGLSPDGNVKMFTSRCDAGQSWDGVSSCTGVRLALNWASAATSTGIVNNTTGKANSAALNALTDAGAPYSAAQYCESLSLNGHTDWYLPSINELLVLAANRAAIRNFNPWVDQGYWSSAEDGPPWAWTVYINSQWHTLVSKTVGQAVRCVRR